MGRKNTDQMTKTGAEELARKIRDYWLRRGVMVNVWIECNVTYSEGSTRHAYVVRSDLKVNHVRHTPTPRIPEES